MSDAQPNDPHHSGASASPPTPINPVSAVSGLQFERLIFFSDAVMAIAITLLAVEFRLPSVGQDAEIGPRVLALVPQVQSYILSFIVIGLYWVDHHRVFSYIRHLDATLIWLNLLFLLWIGFLPFPTSLIGSYQNERAVLILYAGTVAMTGIMRTAIWWYAVHDHRLVDQDLNRRLIRNVLLSGLIPPAIFLASIPVAVFSPTIVVTAWNLMLAVSFLSSLRPVHHPRPQV